MAKLKINPALGQLSGRVGDLVYRKYGVTTVVYEYKKPDTSNPSIRQKSKRAEFKKATVYAKKAMRDPVMKLQYQLKARDVGKGNAYNAAMKDFLNKPTLQSIDIFDNVVVIDARDDFRVERVEVKVLDREGVVLEKGLASLLGDGFWHYYFQGNGIVHEIAATAFDIPGNSVQGFAKK